MIEVLKALQTYLAVLDDPRSPRHRVLQAEAALRAAVSKV